MKKTFWILLTLATLAVLGRQAWRAQHNLVTLEVHDADLADVVRQLKWQTWESIYVGKNVTGKVTLKVHNQPLEVVLDILNEQVNGRWSVVYPLYTTSRSLKLARALAGGMVESPVTGWTHWNGQPGGRPTGTPETADAGKNPNLPGGQGAPGGGFRGPDAGRSSSITASFTNRPPVEVAATLRRLTGTRVVPEDGTSIPVTLRLENVPVEVAVAAVAKKTVRKWARLYVFEGRPNGPLPKSTEVTTNGDGQGPARRPEPTEEQREQMRQQMASDPARQEQAINRMMSSLVNSTPQQRAERDQMRLARQKAQARR